MPPCTRRAPLARPVLLLTLLALASASPAHALRIVNYNLHDYPGSTGATRDLHFRTILGPLSPDLVVVQEMQSQAGVDEFRNNVLNFIAPGEWASAPFTNGNDTDNALFYKPAAVQFLGQWAWYPNPAALLRYVNCYRLKPVGYASAAAELRVYSQHLKASTGFEAQRLAEATGIRDSMNAMPPGTQAILMGDFNIYTGTEPAFLKLLESQVDNDGRLYDPLNAPPITWNTASLAPIHTQSPCATCPGGFSSGGLDDRFDMFLPTYGLRDGEGLDLLVSTYRPIGNDGQHFNKNITDAPTIPEGAGYATALWSASDHLPIRVDLQLPARIDAPAAIAMGTVIVGGGADLVVANVAGLPADELTYTLSAPAGFTAPPGVFNVEVGPLSKVNPLGTAAGPPGPRAGDLVISSDDPEQPLHTVSLTAQVLDHAMASLDSLAVVTSASLDFGTQAPGAFVPQTVRVHNQGYDALQARLALTGATIDGGDGRFAIVGGFAPALIAGVGQDIDLTFDDAGATADSFYAATLTLQSNDETLPGAEPQLPLTVALQARMHSGPVAVASPALPERTRLLAPFPNPLERASTVRFDLARGTDARIEVLDLGGRRVRWLARQRFEAGRHALSWDGRDADGRRVVPGLYFVRLTGAGLAPQTARLAVVR